VEAVEENADKSEEYCQRLFETRKKEETIERDDQTTTRFFVGGSVRVDLRFLVWRVCFTALIPVGTQRGAGFFVE
jgi:hypothetical protein